MQKTALIILLQMTLLTGFIHAQVLASAKGESAHLWAGAEYSYFSSDWAHLNLPGLGVYADVPMYHRYGLEGEARFLNFTKPGGLTEKTYVGGPYATVYRYRAFSADVKFLVGAAQITYPLGIGHGSYLVYDPGGAISYQFSRRLKARVGYEYELIPSAPGLAGLPDNGLTPRGISGGVSYRVF